MQVPLAIALGMDKFIGALSTVANALPDEHLDTRKDLEAYYDLPLEKVFPKPPVPKSVYISTAKPRGPVTAQDFRFDSAYEPLTPGYKTRHEREYAANRQVMGRILHHSDGHPRPIALYIHGWMQSGAQIEERVLFPKLQRELDVDIAHLHLPFHGRRKPADQLVHGTLFWTSDLVRSFEAMRQSVSDVRQVVYYLQERFQVPVGLVGVSLGGVVAMTTLCVEESLAFAVPIIAHQSLSDAVMRAPILTRMNKELSKQGLTQESLQEIERKIGLGRLKPAIPPERQLWINARNDLLIHADAVERQWEAWGKPPIRWYEGSHMSIVFELSNVTRWCREFLDGLQLVPRHGARRRVA